MHSRCGFVVFGKFSMRKKRGWTCAVNISNVLLGKGRGAYKKITGEAGDFSII